MRKYPPPWRVGTKGLRTIYDASQCGDGGLPGRSLGRMDTPELAATDPGIELAALRLELRRLLEVEPADEGEPDEDPIPERLSRRWSNEPAAVGDYPAITRVLSDA